MTQNTTTEAPHPPLRPKLMSFDVFGTLISVRDSSYGAFERILSSAGADRIDVKAFWEHWEHQNIKHYWDRPYQTYRDICQRSLAETFAHFSVGGDSGLVHAARAMGVPTVALFGPTAPLVHELGPKERAVTLGLDCSPCSAHGQRRCPLGHHRCLRDLPAGLVLEHCEAVLS